MPTNSGTRRVVHNTRERILSSDHNREQAFAAAMIADAYRYLFDADASEDEAAGTATLGAALGNPMRAVIFNGLRVRPEIGTFNLFVDAGAGLFVDPGSPASPDDSPAQVIRSAGQQVAGALVIGTAAGSTRIDVVECSTAQVVIETDNRDVFNQSTGAFQPQLVNKVAEAQLTFRVRQGTPGGGFPGTAAGWLPLAVASVPSGAVNNDGVTFWDVRPLLNDFVHATHQVRSSFPAYRRNHVVGVAVSGGGGPGDPWNLKGIVDVEIAGRKVGGNLCPTASGATQLDLSAAGGLQEPGFSVTNDRPWYLYLAFPFGLPRWAKYSPASSGARTPISPRGVPVFTQKAPLGTSPMAGSAISLPTATGLGGSTSTAVVAASGMFVGSFWCGSTTSGPTTNAIYNSTGIAPSSGAGTQSVEYTLVGNTHFPACATALYVQLEMQITLGAGTTTVFDREVQLQNTGGTIGYAFARRTDVATSPGAGSWYDRAEFWLELPPALPAGLPASYKVACDYQVAGTLANQKIYVKGWRMP